ncbi:hypothetical protein LEMLEM_LOCUS17538 [Lemmus lemmus]
MLESQPKKKKNTKT